MAPDDRERNFERALARNLRANVTGGAPASSVGCPDAEILAAYHERLLTPEEMISRKEHIASCMRCQEILAHLEATDEILVEPADLVKDEGLTPQSLFATASMRIPSVPRASSSPSAYEVTPKSAVPLEIRRRTANWRWLAPAGALAAILLVWVAAHERTAPSMQLAKNQPSPNLVVSPAAPPPPPTSTKEESSPRDLQVPSTTKGRASAEALKYSESLQSDQKMAASSQNGTLPLPRSDLPVGDAVAAPAQRSSTAASRAKQAEEGTPAGRPAVPALAKSDSPDNVVALSSTASQDQSSAKKELAVGGFAASRPSEPAKVVQAPKMVAGAVGLRGSLRSPKPILVSSPDGTVTWRLAPSGIVERSSDLGSNWTLQKTGVVADLLAGSAASNDVCWVVGRTGAILRTTDGGNHWQRVSSPTTNDVTSVFAIDAQQATVTNAANQTYKTADAGQTWIPQPQP